MSKSRGHVKLVYFNTGSEQKLFDYANSLGNFSEWVKEQLRRDMHYQQTGVDPVIEDLVKKTVDEHLRKSPEVPGRGKERTPSL